MTLPIPFMRRTSTNSTLSSMVSSLSLQILDDEMIESPSKKQGLRRKENPNAVLPPRSPSKAVRWSDLSSSSLRYNDRWSSDFDMDVCPKRPRRSPEASSLPTTPPPQRKSLWSVATQSLLQVLTTSDK
ncbi:hypothetical protein FisN_11Lu314 [Fistulifera solaris]|uniref:Uncharacterized protein n=1 Tax=Fistulifera solaris TaxID=1519565 RepID=A0A1Z5K0Q2_FISSO|nr:hypothetical protein FisN_11Lu314 [Fistulifera solaris]|eukprot:GAX19827.1 hypothetical protein FisN_11Lu314 [Fistulifera solaris]